MLKFVIPESDANRVNDRLIKAAKSRFAEGSLDESGLKDLVDRAVIAELRTGIPTEALLMVIDTFEAEIAKLAPEIFDAVRARDGETLKDAAHALKGASANLGAARVAHLSGRLEELAHVGDFDGAPALAEELARSVRDTPAALREELSH